jgi:hypothetical protein
MTMTPTTTTRKFNMTMPTDLFQLVERVADKHRGNVGQTIRTLLSSHPLIESCRQQLGMQLAAPIPMGRPKLRSQPPEQPPAIPATTATATKAPAKKATKAKRTAP